MKILQIMLPRPTDLDNFRSHSDVKSRTFKSSTVRLLLQQISGHDPGWNSDAGASTKLNKPVQAF